MKPSEVVLAMSAASALLAGCIGGLAGLSPRAAGPSPSAPAVNDALTTPTASPKTTYTAQEWEVDVARRKKAAPGINRFGFKIFGGLVSGSPAESIALSPTSLGRTVLMAYFGARGSTRDELATALGIADQSSESLGDFVTASGPSLDTKGVALQVSDSAWVRSDLGVLPQFLSEIKDALGAEAKSFATPEDGTAKIGEWIVKASNGLLDGKGFKLGDEHMLALVDVIAFDGRWDEVFDPAETKQRPFHVSSSETIQVPMMRQFGKYAYGESDGYQIISLPYQKSVYSMFVAMASDSASIPSLDDPLFEKLTKKVGRSLGDILLPRFSMKSAKELTDLLKTSGLALSFSDAADFGALATSPIKLSQCFQQVKVSVDETGTVAAAATEMLGEPSSAPPPFHMEVNRPFYFAIRDNSTGTIHFVGKVVKPE